MHSQKSNIAEGNDKKRHQIGARQGQTVFPRPQEKLFDQVEQNNLDTDSPDEKQNKAQKNAGGGVFVKWLGIAYDQILKGLNQQGDDGADRQFCEEIALEKQKTVEQGYQQYPDKIPVVIIPAENIGQKKYGG